jgi:hypothetical protein
VKGLSVPQRTERGGWRGEIENVVFVSWGGMEMEFDIEQKRKAAEYIFPKFLVVGVGVRSHEAVIRGGGKTVHVVFKYLSRSLQ